MTSPGQGRKISSGLALISIDERKIMDPGLLFDHLNIIPNYISSPVFIYKCVLLFANCKSTIITTLSVHIFEFVNQQRGHTLPLKHVKHCIRLLLILLYLQQNNFIQLFQPHSHTDIHTHNKNKVL